MDKNLKEKIISLFEKVRDIPYGDIGSRNPDDVLKMNKGTCSGKHELLKKLFIEIGVEVKDFIVMHTFNDLNVNYPENIKEILKRTEISDPHNFIKILVDEKWLTVDATWDKPLKGLGFPINENWDGESNMDLCVAEGEKIFEVDDPISSKKEEINKFPENVKKDRRIFLQELTKWLDSCRSSNKY
ncbi:hypothetical protein ACFLZH_04075 [Patescibacteria group bacterium]